MTSWRLGSVLLVVTASLFAVGVAAEGSRHHDEAAEHVEGHAEHGTAETERVLGVAVESGTTVAVGVVVSVALAAGLWVTKRRWLAAIVALVAVGFAVLDVGELIHQLDEHRTGLAVLAAAVAVGHFAAGWLAGRPADLGGERADSGR
jgi:hypothetical protein